MQLESMTLAQLDAEVAARAEREKAERRRDLIMDRMARPIPGNNRDLAQGRLFAEPQTDFFHGPAWETTRA